MLGNLRTVTVQRGVRGRGTVFISSRFEVNHLLQWHFRFARSNVSRWWGSGHFPPWRFLSLSSDPQLISLWSPYALAKSSKLPLAHSCYLLLFLGWKGKSSHPGSILGKLWKCPSSRFLSFEVLTSCTQRTAGRRGDIRQCRNAGQWALSFRAYTYSNVFTSCTKGCWNIAK